MCHTSREKLLPNAGWLLLLLFKGSEQQLRAANAYIYKKNTQDPAQGIILHAAGLSRLYTYHLWLVVPGLFLPASPQNIQKIFSVQILFFMRAYDFMPVIEMRACFFMLIVILYTHLLT
jgi:hypothetical protein